MQCRTLEAEDGLSVRVRCSPDTFLGTTADLEAVEGLGDSRGVMPGGLSEGGGLGPWLGVNETTRFLTALDLEAFTLDWIALPFLGASAQISFVSLAYSTCVVDVLPIESTLCALRVFCTIAS